MEIKKNWRKIMKKAIIFLGGSFLLGIGIGFCNVAGWGVDPLAVFTSGIAETTYISFSTANSIVYLIMAILAGILDRKQVTIWTFFSPFATSLGIEVLMRIVPAMPLTFLSFICYLMGIIIMAVGIALSVEAMVGKSPYDALIFSLMTCMNKKYSAIRWPLDALWLIVGFILGGAWGIGTVIALATVGKMMELVQKIIRKQKVVLGNISF